MIFKIVALADVFHIPKVIIIDAVILNSCSFNESCVTLRSGFAGMEGEYRPKAVLNRVFVMIVSLIPTHSRSFLLIIPGVKSFDQLTTNPVYSYGLTPLHVGPLRPIAGSVIVTNVQGSVQDIRG